MGPASERACRSFDPDDAGTQHVTAGNRDSGLPHRRSLGKLVGMRSTTAWLFVGATVGASCTLPTAEEAGKNRCASDRDCPDGVSCVAGVCGGASVTGGDDTIATCPATPCEGEDECFLGLCTEVFDVAPACDPYALEDGCPRDAVCWEDGGGATHCYRFPACPADGTCPIGTHGSVCTEDDLEGKGRFCLSQYCRDASNCPAEWSCVRLYSDGDPFGACGNGESGMPCRTGADCISNNCQSFMHFCQ